MTSLMPKKPDHISQEDWDAVDVPEPANAELAEAVPFAQMFPEQATALKQTGGRPRVDRPKVKVGWRLSADVVDAVKASGAGFNGRVDSILRDAIAKGLL